MRSLIEAASSSDEHWEVVNIYGKPTNVGWNIRKDALNRRNHKLSLREGIPVINNPVTVSTVQWDDIDKEEREVYMGPGRQKTLVVVAKWIDAEELPSTELPTVRLISVRAADARDRRKMTEDRANPQELPPNDPDNPPLTGNEVWVPARERFLKKYAEQEAKIAARKKASAQLPKKG